MREKKSGEGAGANMGSHRLQRGGEATQIGQTDTGGLNLCIANFKYKLHSHKPKHKFRFAKHIADCHGCLLHKPLCEAAPPTPNPTQAPSTNPILSEIDKETVTK